MSKLTIKTQENGTTQLFIDDKRIERVCEFSVSRKCGEPVKATISFYPNENDVELEKKDL